MEKQKFENLISLARQESSPCVDVADKVMSALSTVNRQNTSNYSVYTWAGAASAAVAACILVATTMFWQSSSDSVSDIINYVSWVTQ